MIIVDTDNALGSPLGDVDDAFAIAALLKGSDSVVAIYSVFGNTFESWAHQNNLKLAALLNFKGKVLRGASNRRMKEAEAIHHLSSVPAKVKIIALGPLTNISRSLEKNPDLVNQISEIVVVATNLHRRLPAWRIFDFNQWQDPKSFRAILESEIPVTILPTDVARSLRASYQDVCNLPGEIGNYLAVKSKRWFLRSRLLKGVKTVPVWDLGAVLFALNPSLFQLEKTKITLGTRGEAYFGSNESKAVKVITQISRDEAWRFFSSLLLS